MASLWTGVAHDSLTPALPAFFPKGAYVQLKAIAAASSDWTDRLVHDYGLDIAAAHALLGANAAHARLIGVNVPATTGTGFRQASVTTASATTRCPMRASSTAWTVASARLASPR